MNIISSDESFYDNVKHKMHWIDKDESLQLTTKTELHRKKKVMLCVPSDHYSIIHFQFLKPQSDNANLYSQQVQRVHENLLRKHPTLVNWRNVVLLFDSAWTQSVRITDLEGSVLPHPPYSPDLASIDFYFFRFLQNTLNEKNFLIREDQMKMFVENVLSSKAAYEESRR